jgi:hypothetical protein
VQFLLDKINAVALWLLSVAVWFVEKAFDLLTTGLGLVLQAIPVPSWLAGAGGIMGAMPPGVAYLAQAFQIPSGVAILIAAYTLRFTIRRIPFIG